MNMIDQIFGISPQVLSIRSQRSEMIAANLANVDTPGYKARDIDFSQALASVAPGNTALKTTDNQHLGAQADQLYVRYRMPSQPSMDGNTVEAQQEHAAFMDNAIRYEASLNFLDRRIQSILSTLRGE